MAGDTHTDGNGVAGLLSEILTIETTSVRRVCADCGDDQPLGEHLCVDAACVARPARRRGPRVGAGHGQRRELGAVEDVLGAARGDEQVGVDGALARRAVAQHRHQRHDARSAAHEQQRPAVVGAPREVPADRPADLELVAGAHLLHEVGRDLAVVDELDGQLQRVELGRRGDRVRALRLVAVVRGEADVDMLAGAVSRPPGHVERDRARPRRLGDDLAHGRRAPDQARPRSQSLQYRCSRHGSP